MESDIVHVSHYKTKTITFIVFLFLLYHNFKMLLFETYLISSNQANLWWLSNGLRMLFLGANVSVGIPAYSCIFLHIPGILPEDQSVIPGTYLE